MSRSFNDSDSQEPPRDTAGYHSSLSSLSYRSRNASHSGSSGFTHNSYDTVSNAAWPAQTPTDSSASQPTDPLKEKLRHYLLGLLHNPGKSPQDCAEAAAHLNQLFDQLIVSPGLTQTNQEQCEAYLTRASQTFWNAKNKIQNASTEPGAALSPAREETKGIGVSTPGSQQAVPAWQRRRQRLNAQQTRSSTQALTPQDVYTTCSCSVS